MIEKLLGTFTKVSVARVLVLNPERFFSLNELASASGCSPSTLYQQLDDLVGVIAERTPEGIRTLKDSRIFVPRTPAIFGGENIETSASESSNAVVSNSSPD